MARLQSNLQPQNIDKVILNFQSSSIYSSLFGLWASAQSSISASLFGLLISDQRSNSS